MCPGHVRHDLPTLLPRQHGLRVVDVHAHPTGRSHGVRHADDAVQPSSCLAQDRAFGTGVMLRRGPIYAPDTKSTLLSSPH